MDISAVGTLLPGFHKHGYHTFCDIPNLPIGLGIGIWYLVSKKCCETFVQVLTNFFDLLNDLRNPLSLFWKDEGGFLIL